MAEKNSLDNIVIATVSSTHADFSERIAEYAGQNGSILNIMDPHKFSGKEYCPRFKVPVIEKNVYLIATQGPFQNPQEMMARIAFAASAAKTNGARRVTAVMTDLPFSRQDRGPKEDSRMIGQPLSAEVQAAIFAATGVDRVLTMHLHSEKLYSIYANVYRQEGKNVLYGIVPDFITAHYFRSCASLNIKENGSDIVFIAVDKGSIPYIRRIKKLIGLPYAGILCFSKKRKEPNKETGLLIDIDSHENVTLLENKIGIIADDIVDTGGTLGVIGDALNTNKFGLGKMKGLYIYFTHPVLAADSYKQKQSDLIKIGAREIICTNTRPYIAEIEKQDEEFKKRATILLIEKLFAHAIINCCERNKHPEEVYTFATGNDGDEQASKLYEIKRSELFIEKDIEKK